MVRKLRGVLIAILLLAMVATIGGVEAVRSKSLTGGARDGGTAAADRGAGAKDEGLLSQWWNGAKNIVGQPKLAELLGVPHRDAQHGLDELIDANLAVPEPPGCYRLPELVARFAMEDAGTAPASGRPAGSLPRGLTRYRTAGRRSRRPAPAGGSNAATSTVLR